MREREDHETKTKTMIITRSDIYHSLDREFFKAFR